VRGDHGAPHPAKRYLSPEVFRRRRLRFWSWSTSSSGAAALVRSFAGGVAPGVLAAVRGRPAGSPGAKRKAAEPVPECRPRAAARQGRS